MLFTGWEVQMEKYFVDREVSKTLLTQHYNEKGKCS